LKDSFLTATEKKSSSREAWSRAARQDTYRRRRDDEQEARTKRQTEDQGLDAVAVVAGLVDLSISEARTLTTRLEWHQVALVEALEANRVERELAEERLSELADAAFVMVDGRRVFRTADGMRVIDENGQEVSEDELDPDLIETWRPDAEDFLEARDHFDALSEERSSLFAYQEALQDAEGDLTNGNLGPQDLAEIEALLDESTPDRVRHHLPETDPASWQNYNGPISNVVSDQPEPTGRTPSVLGSLEF